MDRRLTSPVALAVAIALAAASAASASARENPPVDGDGLPGCVIAAGGLVLLVSLDVTVEAAIRDMRSKDLDDLSSIVRPMGEWQVYVPLALGTLATGLIDGNRDIERAGMRLCASLALTGGLMPALKHSIGRKRPDEASGPHAYDVFSNHGAAPSGHTAMAFAIATSLSHEIERPWVSYALYGMAGLTGWSRLNDGEHWLSDVGAGALVGWGVARLVTRHLHWDEGSRPVLRAGGRGCELGWAMVF